MINVSLLLAHLSVFVFSEAETNGISAQADLEQDKEGSGDEGSDCESSPDQGDIMDFSVSAIAEQLTRLDSVSDTKHFLAHVVLSDLELW